MRVAQVMAGAPAGGAELFFERLSVALTRAGETVLPVIRRDPARARRLAHEGLAPVQLGFGGPLDLLTGPRLARALEGFAPRVVIAWMGRAARFARRGRWVLVGRLGGFYDLRRFRRCEHLVGNTRGLVAWITAQGWPPRRAHYLPNFVLDMAGAKPLPRAALGVPDGAKLVLALGRLHRNKGFDVLIRALPRLPDAHALIAGEGPERAALEALARAEGVAARVHLPGWREDTAGRLASCDVLACPSRHEPLGNVVIEGWSARVPVVAAAAQGPAELLTPDRDGLLVPREDALALAEALGAVLRDPASGRALAEAGRARFEADFAEAPVLARWRAFLASVEKP
ncbi:MAG TPA: glycosyltransferase [Acetobacteraceae bacterium]|nr:glycosyltransferase [Acetobacteraceae bacterium]